MNWSRAQYNSTRRPDKCQEWLMTMKIIHKDMDLDLLQWRLYQPQAYIHNLCISLLILESRPLFQRGFSFRSQRSQLTWWASSNIFHVKVPGKQLDISRISSILTNYLTSILILSFHVYLLLLSLFLKINEVLWGYLAVCGSMCACVSSKTPNIRHIMLHWSYYETLN
jgi:hypothetical protein